MKGIAILIFLLSLFIPVKREIITRHDKADEEYIEFARQLPVTSAIVKYNSTDVAGTLISSKWVLSAAHVAEMVKEDDNLILGGDSVEVDKIVIHPGWLENGRPEDIAVIKLKKDVYDVEPVGIYSRTDEMGKEVTLVGHGDFGTGLTGPKGNDGRFRAGTNLVDEARDGYLIWLFDDPCKSPDRATPMEAVSGPGDSSGPAFIKMGGTYYIAGISSGQSTSATNGREGLYGVTEYYTRVSDYAGWIEEVILE